MARSLAKHQYPDHTLEEALVKQGFHVRCHWQERGPKNTAIVWMEFLHVSNGDIAGCMIVQTFDGGGWNVFVEPTHKNSTDETIAAVIQTLTAA